MDPRSVLRALADLAPVGSERILDVTKGGQALAWLKADLPGEIEVAGPELAASLTDLGLIDEYQLYFRPGVLGRGKPFFARARPPLRLVANEVIGEDAIRLTYVPA